MKEKLTKLFIAYLAEHHPDMLYELKLKQELESFVKACLDGLDTDPDKMFKGGIPEHVIEEICLNQLAGLFGPSQYDYLISLLRDEFGYVLDNWKARDVLPSAAVALLENCRPLFEVFKFGQEDEDSQGLRDALIKAIYRSLRPPASHLEVDQLLEGLLNPRT